MGVTSLRMGSACSTLAHVAGIDFAIQWICFLVANALKTEMFYDFSGSCTYAVLVLYTLSAARQFTRQKVNSGLVLLWAVRLGSFLLGRILRDGKDSRFDKVRHK